MKAILPFILARLKEPSTWRGLIGIATAAGATVQPEVATQIITVGIALAGAVGAFTADPATSQDTPAS